MKLSLIMVLMLIASVFCGYGANYDWSSQVKDGENLKTTLKEETDNIIVTFWLRHIRHDEEQNMRNLVLQGSVKNLIEKCHPNVKYTEADLSSYNLNAYTFEEKAQDWNVDVRSLDDGPLVMAVYVGQGQTFWGTKNTMPTSILNALDAYIRGLEKTYYGREAASCKVELNYSKVEDFQNFDPWNNYAEYKPNGGKSSTSTMSTSSSSSSAPSTSPNSGSTKRTTSTSSSASSTSSSSSPTTSTSSSSSPTTNTPSSSSPTTSSSTTSLTNADSSTTSTSSSTTPTKTDSSTSSTSSTPTPSTTTSTPSKTSSSNPTTTSTTSSSTTSQKPATANTNTNTSTSPTKGTKKKPKLGGEPEKIYSN